MIYVFACRKCENMAEIDVPIAERDDTFMGCCGGRMERVIVNGMWLQTRRWQDEPQVKYGISMSEKERADANREGDKAYAKAHKDDKKANPRTVDSIPESFTANVLQQAGLL